MRIRRVLGPSFQRLIGTPGTAQRDILQEAFDQIEAEDQREFAVEDARFDATLA